MRTSRTAKRRITATREDYLRAIYLLGQQAPVGVTDTARRLKLSKSTVSERMKELVREGLVEAEHYSSAVSLTPAGVHAAEVLTYKHRVIEVFLHDILGVPKSRVHEEAERLEHACSDDVIKRLAAFLEHPTADPHGTAITRPRSW